MYIYERVAKTTTKFFPTNPSRSRLVRLGDLCGLDLCVSSVRKIQKGFMFILVDPIEPETRESQRNRVLYGRISSKNIKTNTEILKSSAPVSADESSV